MSDFIFVTESTESSGEKTDNENKFGKGTRYKKGAIKMVEKRANAHLAQKSKQRHIVDN